MDSNQALSTDIQKLQAKSQTVDLPAGLREKIDDMLDRLNRSAKYGHFSQEYESVSHYIDWIIRVPWQHFTDDNINIDQARQIMDQYHYGLEPVKQRMLEFLATVKLNRDQHVDLSHRAHAPILCLVGLAGTGKTTFAYALAEAMGRKIARIPFGGLGSAKDLRGQSRLHPESEPGFVIKAISEAGSSNPILLLDEIDRVAQQARPDVMGVLLALLDPGQNKAFLDHYLDFPINLNQVLFIATCNNTDNISTAVKNRLEIIQMPTYSDEEKIYIGQHYLLPQAIKQSGLKPEQLHLQEDIWPLIVRPLGFDSGIRILARAVDRLVRKAAFQVVSQNLDAITINQDNYKDYVEQFY